MITSGSSDFVQADDTWKIDRYKWKLKDAPGSFAMISKGSLNLDHEYQRNNVSKQKVAAIRSNWSWVGCGCLIVMRRGSGKLFVIDGQHRLLAALHRPDVLDLPCLVFESNSIESEATGFLVSNTQRKPVAALDKFNAMVITNDETAVFVDDCLKKHGIQLTANALGRNTIRCVAKLLRCASIDKHALDLVVQVAKNVCTENAIPNDIIDGLFYIQRSSGLLRDTRFLTCLMRHTSSSLVDSISRYASAEGKRTPKVCAQGILSLTNKNLRQRFEIT